MLPDFPDPKARALRDLMRHVRRRVPVVEPLLDGIPTFRQHEGKNSELTRWDESKTKIDYKTSEFLFTLSREEMRRLDTRAIQEKLEHLAQEMGADQTKRMLEVIQKAAAEVGNVVRADGELTQETFLEVYGRVQMDFDPKTLQLLPGFSLVMHPDMAAKVMPRIREWESDPIFKAKFDEVMAKKREEWRDREARRKLVS